MSKARIAARFDQVKADSSLADPEKVHRQLMLLDEERALRRPCLSDASMRRRSDELARQRASALQQCSTAGQLKACLGVPSQ